MAEPQDGGDPHAAGSPPRINEEFWEGAERWLTFPGRDWATLKALVDAALANDQLEPIEASLNGRLYLVHNMQGTVHVKRKMT